MKIFQPMAVPGNPVTSFNSVGVNATTFAQGEGDAHLHNLRFEPGGEIGEHPTGFAQIFWVVSGSGWVADHSRQRQPITVGDAVYFERGELHAKGSDGGMEVLMIQVRDLQLAH